MWIYAVSFCSNSHRQCLVSLNYFEFAQQNLIPFPSSIQHLLRNSIFCQNLIRVLLIGLGYGSRLYIACQCELTAFVCLTVVPLMSLSIYFNIISVPRYIAEGVQRQMCLWFDDILLLEKTSLQSAC